MRNAKMSGMSKDQALRQFLRAYRETPHCSTGVAPNQLFLGFCRTSGLPEPDYSNVDIQAVRKEWYEMAMAKDKQAKLKMQVEFD